MAYVAAQPGFPKILTNAFVAVPESWSMIPPMLAIPMETPDSMRGRAFRCQCLSNRLDLALKAGFNLAGRQPNRLGLALIWLLALSLAFGHDFFDLVGRARQARGEQLCAGGRDQHVVFDAHAEIFLGNVDARLIGDDHSGFERAERAAGIVHVKADMVAQPVNEITAQRAALLVLPVRIDVIRGDLLQLSPNVTPGFMAASAAFCAPRTIS